MHSESHALVELSNHPTRVTKMKTGYAAERLQPPAPPGFRSGGLRMEDGGWRGRRWVTTCRYQQEQYAGVYGLDVILITEGCAFGRPPDRNQALAYS